jgi:hypothetical protein
MVVRGGFLGIVVAFALAACAGSPRTGPTEVRNDSDRTGVVRLVGATGSVDLAVPPHTVVVVEAPPAIGKVASAWLTVDDCRFKGGTIYGDDTNGWASFEAGGLLWFGDNSSGGTTGWADSPPPAAVAATTSICAAVPTPSVH